eukprot:CAMPEP_0185257310 /NCGR_PEP_ID=MMETSP1359-20130426/6376_1 /TAXON_ID=552665 /ORGANISM="Bigelowiella longifila, Strain CCMP242" /LENGTH=272 /DNA_ID=CAMNT_0027842337 /DNA_START=229 /DNA_END=1044 /DNA_ORIENTATION=+
MKAVEEDLINERKRTQADSLDHFFAEGKGKVNLSNSQSMYEGYCAKAMSRMNRSQDRMWEYKDKGQKRIVVSLSFPTPSGIKNISIAAMQECKPKLRKNGLSFNKLAKSYLCHLAMIRLHREGLLDNHGKPLLTLSQCEEISNSCEQLVHECVDGELKLTLPQSVATGKNVTTQKENDIIDSFLAHENDGKSNGDDVLSEDAKSSMCTLQCADETHVMMAASSSQPQKAKRTAQQSEAKNRRSTSSEKDSHNRSSNCMEMTERKPSLPFSIW